LVLLKIRLFEIDLINLNDKREKENSFLI